MDGFRHCGGTGELASPYREIHTKMVGRPLRDRRFSILPATAAVRPVSSCGVLFWSWDSCLLATGRFHFVMGRFVATPGGATSPLPAIRLHTGRGSVPAARFAFLHSKVDDQEIRKKNKKNIDKKKIQYDIFPVFSLWRNRICLETQSK